MDAGSTDVPICFVSYSHDSDQHKEHVLSFAQHLRLRGIDVRLDRFVEHAPPVNWPRWMYDQIEQSDFVIAIITPTYAERFRGVTTANLGRGVSWEGAIITQQVYDNFSGPVKFIPVIIDETSDAVIPFPLSATSRHRVSVASSADLDPLVGQLLRLPTVVPEPLGAFDRPARNDRFAEVRRAVDEADMAGVANTSIDRLEALTGDADPSIAASAAYHLGEMLYREQKYSRSVQAFRFAVECGPKTGVYRKATGELAKVLAFLDQHYGETSAVAKVYEILNLVQLGHMPDIWIRIDSELRLALTQAWILSNESHPEVATYDRDELAASLSSLAPQHPLSPHFFRSQLSEFQQTYQNVDLASWGAAEKPRRFRLEYELVILMPTDGEVLIWEPNMTLPACGFVMRRRLHEWCLAGFETGILRPGWPPMVEKLDIDGVGFVRP